MEMALCDSAEDEFTDLIAASQFIGLMVDESIDIATHKKLILYVKFVCDGKSKIIFGDNIEIAHGKAETVYDAMLSFLSKNSIPLSKVVGFSSDGVSVMMGKKNGVGIRLTRCVPFAITTHCAAHRLALAAFHAAKGISFLTDLQTTMNNIYNFFSYSPARYQKIRELSAVMHANVKRFKRPSSVRWLSIYEAVDALHGCWSVLVLAQEHEVSVKNTPEAKGILKKVKMPNFLLALCLLKDVLSAITKLSKVFQEDVIDIGLMTSMLSATVLSVQAMIGEDSNTVKDLYAQIRDSEDGSFHGVVVEISESVKQQFSRLRENYLRALIDQLEKRFPNDQLNLLGCLNAVLNPACIPSTPYELARYGEDKLEVLLSIYGEQHTVDGTLQGSLIAEERTKMDFLQFKCFAAAHKHMNLQEFCFLLIRSGNQLTDFTVLAQIVLAVPLTSVPCERGFSVQNRLRNASRNRLGIKRLQQKMLIKSVLAAASDHQKIVSRAVQYFHGNKKRRL